MRRIARLALVVILCGGWLGAEAGASVQDAAARPGAAQPPGPAIVEDARPPFDEWLAALRQEALTQGIRTETVEQAFAGLERLEVVVERDRTQAEFVLNLDAYLKRRLTTALVRRARDMRREHRAVLGRVDQEYGVAPEVLVAVWGLESNFGRFSGVRPTVAALATLAYEPRRAAFFRSELLAALRILDRGDIALASMKGSWAGAMGQPQFMPSTYLQHAVDFDRDGRRDIWRSLPDVFASIANYLKAYGWTDGERWGREVRLPKSRDRLSAEAPPRESGCFAIRTMSRPLPLRRWHELGVRLPNGRRLPRADVDASLVTDGRRSFLVYRNYEAILGYNCAHTYALSVGLLANRLAGSAPRTGSARRSRARR